MGAIKYNDLEIEISQNDFGYYLIVRDPLSDVKVYKKNEIVEFLNSGQIDANTIQQIVANLASIIKIDDKYQYNNESYISMNQHVFQAQEGLVYINIFKNETNIYLYTGSEQEPDQKCLNNEEIASYLNDEHQLDYPKLRLALSPFIEFENGKYCYNEAAKQGFIMVGRIEQNELPHADRVAVSSPGSMSGIFTRASGVVTNAAQDGLNSAIQYLTGPPNTSVTTTTTNLEVLKGEKSRI